MIYYIAAALLLVVGAAHSVLGEKLLLKRLFALENLPALRGSRGYTMRLLRVAWHITTLLWLGFAAMFILIANDSLRPGTVLSVIAATFLLSAVTALVASRGKHLSWMPFLLVGAIALVGASWT